MSETLYRKYRPSNFSGIVNQNHIKITLQRAVAKAKISHAYLFTGPRGVGKTTTARVFAKAINCLQPKEGEPCGQCKICQAISQTNFLDLVELDAASRRKIDEIKEFKEHIKYPPNLAKYKVFIIDEVHMLTEVSFNALLKTLEEPPAHSIFILCTTAIHKIPETIISRCQRYDFRRLSITDIVDNLDQIALKENLKIEKQILQTIAKLSEGSLRDAQGMINQIIALGDKEISWSDVSLLLPRSDLDLTISFWNHLVKREAAAAISLINRLIDEGVDLFYFANELLELIRNLLLIKIDRKLDNLSELLAAEKHQELTKQLDMLTLDFLKNSLDILFRRLQEMKSSQIQQLPLELAVVEITNLQASDSKKINKTDDEPPAPSAANTESGDTTNQSVSRQSEQNKNSDDKPGSKIQSLSPSLINRFISEIASQNYSLAGILKNSRLTTSNNSLIIEVNHTFHKEQLQKEKNYELIKNYYENFVSGQFSIEIIVSGNVPADQETKEKLFPVETAAETNVDDIIKVMGGKVLEGGVMEE